MNIKNKYHSVYLDYASCLMLKKLGFPQENATAYWFKNDKHVYTADKAAKFKGWDKVYIRAITGSELLAFMPAGIKCEKVLKYLWTAKFQQLQFSAITLDEAVCCLFQKLVLEKIISI